MSKVEPVDLNCHENVDTSHSTLAATPQPRWNIYRSALPHPSELVPGNFPPFTAPYARFLPSYLHKPRVLPHPVSTPKAKPPSLPKPTTPPALPLSYYGLTLNKAIQQFGLKSFDTDCSDLLKEALKEKLTRIIVELIQSSRTRQYWVGLRSRSLGTAILLQPKADHVVDTVQILNYAEPARIMKKIEAKGLKAGMERRKAMLEKIEKEHEDKKKGKNIKKTDKQYLELKSRVEQDEKELNQKDELKNTENAINFFLDSKKSQKRKKRKQIEDKTEKVKLVEDEAEAVQLNVYSSNCIDQCAKDENIKRTIAMQDLIQFLFSNPELMHSLPKAVMETQL